MVSVKAPDWIENGSIMLPLAVRVKKCRERRDRLRFPPEGADAIGARRQ
jgi:hypothetical protein